LRGFRLDLPATSVPAETPRRRAVAGLLALLFAVVALAGCGGDGAGDAKKIADELRTSANEVAQRIRDAIDALQKAVPRAGSQSRPPQSKGNTIEEFLTGVLTSVDSYWTRTLTANGLPEPHVGHVWIPPGRQVRTRCGNAADQTAAFYCPTDDTIYVGETITRQIISGAANGFPGQQLGFGHAVGDFGAAYVIAHEYAHNVQQELGLFNAIRTPTVAPFELQADCMAGLWGNSVYRQGKVSRADVQEAIDTALAVGDFEFGSAQHHGTPQERAQAWLLGFRSGDPPACSQFLIG
jgi:predicted metalloprotease